MIVLVNAMVPLPGEIAGQWWDATGAIEAREAADRAAGRSTDFDMDQHFLHDIDADTLAWMWIGSAARTVRHPVRAALRVRRVARRPDQGAGRP